LTEGAAVDAAQTFAAILEEDPASGAALSGLARAHIALGELDHAAALLNNPPAEITSNVELNAARAQLALAIQALNAGPEDEFRTLLAADAENHQARFDLAQALYDAEAAIKELLELFRRDRDWNEAAAKTQLFTIFGALKPNDPLGTTGRRRLSSMIFA
jgi:putative thioredoxin